MQRKTTPRQQEVLDIIVKGFDAHGRPPTYRAIGEQLGISVGNVADHIKRLEQKGYLKRPNSSHLQIDLGFVDLAGVPSQQLVKEILRRDSSIFNIEGHGIYELIKWEGL